MPYDVDDQGRRRMLTGWETTWWYGFAGVTYIAASIAEKSLLNWIIGPLWLVVVVTVGPALVDRARAQRARP